MIAQDYRLCTQFGSSASNRKNGIKFGAKRGLLAASAAAVAALLLPPPAVQAANSTWLDTGTTSANWNDPTNWVGGVIPGATTGTTDTSVATFNTAVGTEGTSGNPILIDTGRDIGGITFDTASVGAYTISGGPLLLSSGALIQATSTVTANETIKAPLVIEGTNGIATLASSINTSTTQMGFLGGITAGASSGTTTLNLAGSSSTTLYSYIQAVIGNGSSGAIMGVTTTSGKWQLRAINTYGGPTTINGGTLEDDFSDSGQSLNLINSSTSLVMGGGVFLGYGASGANDSQTFKGTSINSGYSTIREALNSATTMNISLGAITRSSGATVLFQTDNASDSMLTTTANTNASILGGWAVTYNGTSYGWATSTGTGSVAGAVTPLPAASYTADAWNSGNNTTVASGANDMPASGSTTNSLFFNNSGTNLITLAGANTITTGGILASAGTNNISGGTLTAGSGNELIINAYAGLTINSTLVDNGSKTGLTFSGSSTLTLGSANTYTGLTTVNSGTVVLNAANTLSSGGVTLNGGTLYANTATSLGTGTLTIAGGTFGNQLNASLTLGTGTPEIWNGNFSINNINGYTQTLNTGTGNNVTLGANVAVNIANYLTFVVPGVISDGGHGYSLTVTGASGVPLILLGANTFSGGVILNSGKLEFGNAGAVGTGTLTINGGSIGAYNGGTTTLNNNPEIWNANINMIGASGTLNTGTGNISLTGSRTIGISNANLGVGGVIADSGGSNFGLVINDGQYGETVTLGGANTFDGGVTINTASNAGTAVLDIGNLGTSASASALGTGTFTFGNIAGGTAEIDNTSGAAGTLATNNPEVWSGNFTFVGTKSLNLGTGAVSLGTSNASNRTVTVNANTLTVGGVISNGTNASTPTISLSKAGAGILILTGANTYTGGTTILNGTLEGTTASLPGTLGFSNASGGTTASLILDETLPAVPIASGTIGAITQTVGIVGSLTKNNAGVISLTGANTYTGTTTVNGGTLQVDNSVGGSLASTSPLTMGGGTFILKGNGTSTTQTMGNLTLTGNSGTSTITVNPNGGNATLALGTFTRNAGSAAFVNGTNLGSSTLVTFTTPPSFVGSTTDGGPTSGTNQALGIIPSLVGEVSTTPGGGGTQTGTPNTLVTYDAGSGLRPLDLTNEYSTDAIVSGDNTRIVNGATASASTGINSLVVAGNSLSITNSATVTDASGALLFSANGSIGRTTTSGGLAFSQEAIITVDSGVTGTIEGFNTSTNSLTITGTSPILTKAGTGTLVLSHVVGSVGSQAWGVSSANETQILAGTIAMTNGSDMPTANGNVAISTGATLDLTNDNPDPTNNTAFTENFNGLTGTGHVIVPANLTLDMYGYFTWAGQISGQGNLLFNPNPSGYANVFTISGTNIFTGTTSISYGTIQLTGVNAIADSSNIAMSGTSTIDLDGTSQSIVSISGLSTDKVTSTAGGKITLSIGGAGLNFAGVIQNGSATSLGLLKTTTGTQSLSGTNTYTGGTNVSQGTLILASASAYPVNTSLTVASGAELKVNNSTGTIFVPQLSALSNTGTIDLTNNGLLVHNGSIGAISTEIKAGFNNGNWNGSSPSAGVILSSTATGDTAHLSAVGVATGLTTFEGSTVAATDVVLKYTYYGDANLDGKVDGSDYSLIDSSFLAETTTSTNISGWYNGDFNYDGVVNGSDYTLIDNAFNSQGAQFSAEIASPTAQIAGGGTSAVPEPASLGLLGIGAIGLLGRRSRRRS